MKVQGPQVFSECTGAHGAGQSGGARPLSLHGGTKLGALGAEGPSPCRVRGRRGRWRERPSSCNLDAPAAGTLPCSRPRVHHLKSAGDTGTPEAQRLGSDPL